MTLIRLCDTLTCTICILSSQFIIIIIHHHYHHRSMSGTSTSLNKHENIQFNSGTDNKEPKLLTRTIGVATWWGTSEATHVIVDHCKAIKEPCLHNEHVFAGEKIHLLTSMWLYPSLWLLLTGDYGPGGPYFKSKCLYNEHMLTSMYLC